MAASITFLQSYRVRRFIFNCMYIFLTEIRLNELKMIMVRVFITLRMPLLMNKIDPKFEPSGQMLPVLNQNF